MLDFEGRAGGKEDLRTGGSSADGAISSSIGRREESFSQRCVGGGILSKRKCNMVGFGFWEKKVPVSHRGGTTWGKHPYMMVMLKEGPQTCGPPFPDTDSVETPFASQEAFPNL